MSTASGLICFMLFKLFRKFTSRPLSTAKNVLIWLRASGRRLFHRRFWHFNLSSHPKMLYLSDVQVVIQSLASIFFGIAFCSLTTRTACGSGATTLAWRNGNRSNTGIDSRDNRRSGRTRSYEMIRPMMLLLFSSFPWYYVLLAVVLALSMSLIAVRCLSAPGFSPKDDTG
ncbi:hypothetical protein EV356DRAFT_500180 [Viridothelium virens]|uniref:Uncharacterized protein n=1 Tax=Viridothelium virens TaxID=1048519 RepID=A0A6A6HBY4_VIRVR|nr:hypothetical protein EV356DRAFT_500180 [Viridothelium virens]